MALPEFPDRDNKFENGRNIYEGYQRGWGLQFGDLRKQVLQDKVYSNACELIAGRSVVSEENRMNLFLIIKYYLSGLDSQNIIEFGSYKGGSALFMAYCLREFYPNARIFALDTYEGMPETDKKLDLHNAGDFDDVNLDELVSYAEKLKLENINFVKGRFENTLPGILADEVEFGMAHIDCDIYSGVAYAQEAIISSLSPGGYLVYDDACVSSCIGATQAVEEFMIMRRQHSEQIWPHFVLRKTI